MLGKYSKWVYRNGIYRLFLSTELLSEMYYDEENKEWNYTISVRGSNSEHFAIVNIVKDESVDVAKETVENIVDQIMTDSAMYYKKVLDIWKGDLDVKQW